MHCFFILWEIFPRNPERHRLRSHLPRSGSLRRRGAFPVPLHRCLRSHPTESAFPAARREGQCCGLDSQRVSPDVCLRVESGCQQVMVHFVPILTAQQSQRSCDGRSFQWQAQCVSLPNLWGRGELEGKIGTSPWLVALCK